MCDCQEPPAAGSAGRGAPGLIGSVPPVVSPGVPLAETIGVAVGEVDPLGAEGTGPLAGPVMPPIPPVTSCREVLRSGCYALSFTPGPAGTVVFEGTLRVDRSAPDPGRDNILVSGDLYRRPLVLPPSPVPPLIAKVEALPAGTSR